MQRYSTPRALLSLTMALLIAMMMSGLATLLQPAASVGAAGADVLILGSTVSGGAGSREALAATALGLTVEVATNAQWAAKTTADFASYKAIVLGDPFCGFAGPGVTSPYLDAAIANKSVWGPAITGNVLINGTDPVLHYGQGGKALTDKGIAFAVSQAGKTGAYISLSCYYHDVAPGTAVPVLDAFSPGGFSMRGVGCYNDAHIVATHPALNGLTDATLSNWGCSVHEAFDKWPVEFDVLAIARGIGASYTASDGSIGTPYIVARGATVISDIKLTPESATTTVGSAHTLTATVEQDGAPVVGTTVTFTVLSGPHAGQTGTGTTDPSGKATFTYTGTVAGLDFVQATFSDSLGRTQSSNKATVEWEEVTNLPPTADAGGPYSAPEGGSVSLSGSGSDPGDTLSYAWDLDNNGSFETTGQTPTFSAATLDGPTSQTVTLQVCDAGPLCATDTATVNITNVDPTPTIAGAPVTSPEGTAISLSGSASDPGIADTHTYAWSVSKDGTAFASGSGASFGFTPDDDGTYVVTLTATDKDGGMGTDQATVTGTNVAPTAAVTAPAAGSVYAANTPITFAGTYTDPGTADTHTAQWSFTSEVLAAPLTCPATVDASAKTVGASCTFTAAGIYKVELTVTDDDGDSGTATTILGEDTYVVIYDPSAGFVTGGGWINSPAGAYAADPSLTGKASFGFVSKYQKGATTPTGQTEFQFKAGSLNFHSASYQWLVVSGPQAQYKGTGTINGAGSYGFLLTVTDGQINGGGGVDKFRIKIWDTTTGAVVYDNLVGANDGMGNGQAIGGGSIQIMSK